MLSAAIKSDAFIPCIAEDLKYIKIYYRLC